MKRSRMGILACLGAFALVWTAAAWGATDAEKCESKKDKEAGKNALCRLKAQAKAVTKGEEPDYSKCEAKFSDKWGSIETKYGAECPDSISDPNSLAKIIAGQMDDVALLLSGDCTGGVVVGATCWFLGETGENCDTVCGGVSKVYNSATRTYAGDLGTAAHCMEVLDALGVADPHQLISGGPSGLGCMWISGTRYRDAASPTTSGALNGSFKRPCACQ